MTLTWIGLVLLPIGLWLLFRAGVAQMLGLILVTSLMGGAAAVNLPALGGSSIPPTYFALAFLAARICLPGSGASAQIMPAIKDNTALITFCLYGAVTAFILPKIFAGQMNLTAMSAGKLRFLLETSPLKFSTQNITTAVYLLGTMFGAVLAAVVARKEGTAKVVLSVLIAITWAHVLLGLAALVLKSAGLQEIVELFRNGAYAQLDQQQGGFIRISGIFPEPSSYAGYGCVLLFVMTEAWLRDLRPRATGAAAMAMALILVFSTSSSAYVGIGGYAVLLIARFMLVPGALRQDKGVMLFLCAFGVLIVSLLAAVALPKFLNEFVTMVRSMTVEKGQSLSGRQRAFWAHQGVTAFKHSYGLGVGAGSFRSSSLATAIAGSTGVVGLVSFATALWMMHKPFRASTYRSLNSTFEQSLGAACGWAALVGLIPQLFGGSSPDPGLMFGMLSGLALGWRADTQQTPRRVIVQTLRPVRSAPGT